MLPHSSGSHEMTDCGRIGYSCPPAAYSIASCNGHGRASSNPLEQFDHLPGPALLANVRSTLANAIETEGHKPACRLFPALRSGQPPGLAIPHIEYNVRDRMDLLLAAVTRSCTSDATGRRAKLDRGWRTLSARHWLARPAMDRVVLGAPGRSPTVHRLETSLGQSKLLELAQQILRSDNETMRGWSVAVQRVRRPASCRHAMIICRSVRRIHCFGTAPMVAASIRFSLRSAGLVRFRPACQPLPRNRQWRTEPRSALSPRACYPPRIWFHRKR